MGVVKVERIVCKAMMIIESEKGVEEAKIVMDLF